MTLDHPINTPDADHHRPRFHIRPPLGFLNDPNGPIVVDGVTHLYFQYRLSVDTDDPVVWGHASSTDLAHWQLHRAAMTPEPVGLDRDGCWSGNTVTDDHGTVRAFYSGFRREQPYQTVLTAKSPDGGNTFGPPDIAVADPTLPITTMRDPFVWRDADRWWMVTGAGDDHERASLLLHSSLDLNTWQPEGEMASLGRTESDGLDTGSMWECPQVASIDGRIVVFVGAYAELEGTMRVLSVLPDRRAAQTGGLGGFAVDAGPNFYAPSVLRDGELGPVLWGWVTEQRDPAWWRKAGWAGAISLPRHLSLDLEGRVLSWPVPELERLRNNNAPHILQPGAAGSIGAQTELVLRVSGAASIMFGTMDERVQLCFDPERQTIEIDLRESSADVRADGTLVRMEQALGLDGGEVRCFLDGSILEVFTSTGRVATTRLYPLAPPPWDLQLQGHISGRAWSLSD